MKKLLLICSLAFTINAIAGPGDTTKVLAQDHRDMVWYGAYDDVAMFPDGSKTYSQILMHYTMGCSSNGCSDWDYTTQIQLLHQTGIMDSTIASIDTPSTSPLIIDTTWNVFEVIEPYELGRVITPYGGYMARNQNGYNNNWEHKHTFDVTDWAPLLKDSVMIRAFFSGWQDGFSATVEFEFIEGTPPRDVISVENIYQGAWNYIDPVAFEANNMPPTTVAIDPAAKGAMFRFTPSGHGFVNAPNCAEFCVKDYYVFANGNQVATQSMWRDDCGKNPIYPQGGTWLLDRANWCPGSKTLTYEHELTPYITAGQNFDINVDIESYNYTVPSGEVPANYIISGQLFTYGDINFELDASISDILTPTIKDDYKRLNPTCGNALVELKNNGSETLTQAYIMYAVEGGEIQFYQWSGSLEFNETTLVELPFADDNWISWYGKEHVFWASIANVNGGYADENPVNNMKRTEFEVTPSHPGNLLLELRTNNAGHETSWTLENGNGTIVHSGSGYSSNTTIKDTIAVPDGCYTLHIMDSDKDGLSFPWNSDGGGYVRLKTDNGFFIKVFPADFGTEIIYNFTVGYTITTPENSLENQVAIYPNPNAGLFTVDVGFAKEQDLNISIVNMMGTVVYTNSYHNIKNQSLPIDISGKAQGVYWVQIQSGNQTTTKKIVLTN